MDGPTDLTREAEDAERSVPTCKSEQEFHQALDDLGTLQHEAALNYTKKEENVVALRSRVARLKAEIRRLQQEKGALQESLGQEKSRAYVFFWCWGGGK
jgi:polyhydroxyalkanoate synthesis regulator phasin